MIRNLFGRITGRRAPAAPPPIEQQPVRVVPGARGGKELVQLLGDYSPEIFDDGSSWIAELKLDGIRCAMIDDGLYSREGAPMNCALHAMPGLRRVEAEYGRPMVFDCEYVAGTFEETLGDFHRDRGTGTVWVFDAVPLEEWLTGRFTMAIEHRKALLRINMAASDSPFVGFVDYDTVGSAAAAQALAERCWADGLEGIVLKRVGTLYQRRRSDDWRKLKKQVVAICPVLDALFKKDRFVGLLCRGPTGPLKITSGFTDLERAAWTAMAHRGGVAGAKVKLAWNEAAGSDKPRHARFVEVVG